MKLLASRFRIPCPAGVVTLWSVLLFGLAGCSTGPAHAVSPDVARETLQRVLEQWQAGATPESLQQQTPAITVQDMDWSSGAQLVAFEVLEGADPVDANLVARVKLKLRAPAGGETEKTATYLVGTSPVLTVFRDMFRS